MAHNIHQIQIKNRLLSGTKILGNTGRGLKELCSDLLNDYIKGPRAMQEVIDGTFLSRSTIERMMKLTESETGAPYRPAEDTCSRIMIFFGASITLDQVVISPKFLNREKT